MCDNEICDNEICDNENASKIVEPDIKKHITRLIKHINNNNMQEANEMYQILIYVLLCFNETDSPSEPPPVYKPEHLTYAAVCEYITLLYKLIFYVHKTRPEMAYTMLCGLLQFEQTKYNTQYKPLIDHLTVEIFNKLLKNVGWSILLPFTTILHNNLKNFDRELIFTHIQTCVVQQLRMDETEPTKASDLCYNLPREKSYKWGWFSYYVAVSYYCKSLKTTPERMNSKTLRNCMMEYRKLITLLRQSTTKYIEEDVNSIPRGLAEALATTEEPAPHEPAAHEPAAHEPAAHEPAAHEVAYPPRLEENLEKLIIILSSDEYKWLDRLIKNTVPASKQPVQEQPVQELSASDIVHIVAADAELPAEKNSEQEPSPVQVQEQAPVQVQEPSPVQVQSGGWFNWLGWS